MTLLCFTDVVPSYFHYTAVSVFLPVLLTTTTKKLPTEYV